MSMTPKDGMTLEEFAGIMRVNVEVYGEQMDEALGLDDQQEFHYARGSRDAYAYVLRIITNDNEGYLE
jgi:hypothetical protein